MAEDTKNKAEEVSNKGINTILTKKSEVFSMICNEHKIAEPRQWKSHQTGEEQIKSALNKQLEKLEKIEATTKEEKPTKTEPDKTDTKSANTKLNPPATIKLNKVLLEKFENMGFKPYSKFNPHFTIAKSNAKHNTMWKTKTIDQDFNTWHFGLEKASSIQLLDMRKPRDADGYYRLLAEFNLGRPEEKEMATESPDPENTLLPRMPLSMPKNLFHLIIKDKELCSLCNLKMKGDIYTSTSSLITNY